MLGDIKPEQLVSPIPMSTSCADPDYWIDTIRTTCFWTTRKRVVARLSFSVRQAGVSIVDATAIDYGRDPAAVRDISKATGVQIIGTAGFNKGFLWNAKMPGEERTYKEWIDSATEDELTRSSSTRLRSACREPGVRAGQVKFGTGYNSISPLEIKTIRAACRAHLATARRCIRTQRRARWALNSSSISEKRASIRIT